MGFGITGFVKTVTKKALIRYVEPEFNEALKNAGLSEMTLDDFTVQGDGTILGGIEAYAREAIGGYLASFIGVIQEVKPDVRKSELHRYKSNVTQYAVEDGSIFTQHIIQQPIKVSLQFEETNAGFGTMLSGIMNMAQMVISPYSKTMFEQLIDIWEKKIPVEIVTEHRIYKNMVIESLPIAHKSPYKRALQVNVDFIQLSTYQFDVDEKKGKTESVNKSANAVKSGGKQQLEDVSNNTPLQDLVGAEERVSKFNIMTASEEEISQHLKDVDYLNDHGMVAW